MYTLQKVAALWAGFLERRYFFVGGLHIIFFGHHLLNVRLGKQAEVAPAFYDYDAHVCSGAFLYMPFAISALSKAKSIMTTFFAASMRSRASGLGIRHLVSSRRS